MLITFVLGALITVPMLGCGTESDEAELPETQIVTVQRGDLTVDITAAGNLALSRTEDLSIDLFYGQSGTSGTKGTIGEVLVEEGDTVEEGQVLVKLDTDEWNDELSTLEKALVTAQRNLTAEQIALTKAKRQVITLGRAVTAEESDVTAAELDVATKEFAVRQAQVNVQTAEYNLSQIDEVEEAQDEVDDAEDNLKLIKLVLKGVFGQGLQEDFAYWSQLEDDAEEDLERAEEDLQDILEDAGITLSTDVALEVARKQLLVEQEQLDLEDARYDLEDAKLAVEDARYDLEDAKLDVEDAKQDVEDAELDVDDAQQDVEDAQSDLDEAKSLSPMVKAPFDGFITSVNVEGGDEVLSGTVAVQLADPSKFEADIMVSEMDILQIKLAGEAQISVDAMPGMSLPAEITHISPTATISQGVVNYKVKVEIQSMESIKQERQAVRQDAMQNIQQGELPERMKQAIESGQITQEQAEEMMQQGQARTMMPEDFQLREGLTVTVSILVDEASDVLMVPNSAITRQGVQSYVKVVSADGTIEERAIQTGISDWQYTEVTEGLSEGEQIAMPQGTTATTTTQQGSRRGSMPFLPH